MAPPRKRVAKKCQYYRCAGCGGVSKWIEGWRRYAGLKNLYNCSDRCENKVFSIGADDFLALANKLANIDNKLL